MRHMQRLARLLAVSTVGSALLVVGIVMLVTPGPGLLLIFLGVAVFALEFTWAERIRDRVREWAADQISPRMHARLHRAGVMHAPPDGSADAGDAGGSRGPDGAGDPGPRRSRTGSRAA